MIKKLKRFLLLVTFLLLLFLYLMNSNTMINNIIDYSKLFLLKIFPPNFLFFLFSSLLIEYQLLDYCSSYFYMKSPSTYLFLFSLLSGFPAGAKYTKELLDLGYLKEKDANHSLLFCHFPNPIFVFGTISKVLNNNKLSIKIYLSILISNFILFLLFKSKNKISPKKIIENKSFSIILKNSIEKSFHTLLIIYGTSLFFYLIGSIITKYYSFNIYIYILMNGFFDLSKGIFSTTLINNINIQSIFILLFLSFGSISIHIQTSSFLENSNLSYTYYLKGRLIGTILSLIILLCLI